MHEDRAVHPIKEALAQTWPPMSQAQFARRMNMSEATLSKYLLGRRQPPAGFYLAAAEILNRPAYELRPKEIAA